MNVRHVIAVAAILAVGLCAVWASAQAVKDAPAAEKGAKAPAKAEPDIKFIDDEPEPGQGESPSKTAVNPFGEVEKSSGRKDAVPGYAELSKGLKIPGRIYTTRAKRLKVFNISRQLYEYIPVPAIKRMDAVVEWERLEQEWRFKEAGNPEKVYSGRSYPARQLGWKITLRNDHEIVGHILGQPIYIEHGGTADQFLFTKRMKGTMGQTLDDIPYLRSVVFGSEAYNLAVEELKAKAEAAEKQGGKAPEKGGAKPAP